MNRGALAFALSLVLPACAVAAGYPRAVTLPDELPLTRGGVEVQPYAQEEFIQREKTETLGGKVWLGYLDYRKKWGENKRNALAGIIHEMEKGGWEVLLRDEPAVPPLATLKHRDKDGTELWARVEIFDQARVAVLEPGPPPARARRK
jgi:hypothetical protein